MNDNYTLEPGDTDRNGNQYADIDAYNAAQEKLATPKYICPLCGRPNNDSQLECNRCAHLNGGDEEDD